MLAGIREILIISTPDDQATYQRILGSGKQWGLDLQYAVQPSPDGLAQALAIGEQFIGSDSVCLILGDNIFHGHGLSETLQNAASQPTGATVFGYYVQDPERYGVVEFDKQGKAVSIEEKPNPAEKPIMPSRASIFTINDVVDIAKQIKPSPRGELRSLMLITSYL